MKLDLCEVFVWVCFLCCCFSSSSFLLSSPSCTVLCESELRNCVKVEVVVLG